MPASNTLGSTSENAISAHCARLLEALGCDDRIATEAQAIARARPVSVWPEDRLSALVGPQSRPPDALDLTWLDRLEAITAVVSALSRAVGGSSILDTAAQQITERSVMLGLRGSGTIGAGGSCRLFRARDGWIAVSLPRPEDVELVPAWLECTPDERHWVVVSEKVHSMSCSTLVERAELLGLPVADLPKPLTTAVPTPVTAPVESACAWRNTGTAAPLVVDLSSLWAGPLCGWYLARAGARVIKVESTRRPDGSRRGSPDFYRHLNGAKDLVEIDFTTTEGQHHLRALIDEADIVIEASRPRALAALGIDASKHAASGKIWCSITAYGRQASTAMRVGFGDDVGAGAGMITYVENEPWFVGDAVADPISGISSAMSILNLWSRRVAGMIDASMHDAVLSLTGGAPIHSRSS